MRKYDVMPTAIYGYYTGSAYEFIGSHICTQYVSITVCSKPSLKPFDQD